MVLQGKFHLSELPGSLLNADDKIAALIPILSALRGFSDQCQYFYMDQHWSALDIDGGSPDLYIL